MDVAQDTTGKQKVSVHYVNTPLPCTVEENFGGFFHDHDDDALAEVLQDQETVYQSLQRNSQIDVPRASSSANARVNQGNVQTWEENSCETINIESQLAIDEALARELQELENQLVGASIDETAGTETDTSSTGSTTGNGEGSSADRPAPSTQGAEEDDIDPDSMTYEELQSLAEAVGSEDRGLPDDLIAYLPSSTYKAGLFSRRDDHDECVICYMAYRNRDKLITLPCQHQYHKSCITRWLKINKVCPVCTEEVFGP